MLGGTQFIITILQSFFFTKIYILFYYFFYFLTLQYCIGFAIYQNESATGIHVFPILNPPPSFLPIPSLWVIPAHQPQTSSIVHRTWTGNSFHILEFRKLRQSRFRNLSSWHSQARLIPRLPGLKSPIYFCLAEKKNQSTKESKMWYFGAISEMTE